VWPARKTTAALNFIARVFFVAQRTILTVSAVLAVTGLLAWHGTQAAVLWPPLARRR
jgi:hypothetical protein